MTATETRTPPAAPPRRAAWRGTTAGRRTAGLVFLLVPALLAWLAVAVYDKDFQDEATVTVLTGSVGNEMHPGADVKVRGVVVGRVSAIHADGQGARLTLAIDPGQLHRIPAGVTAQMLPTTLFGARFVALVPPADAVADGPTLTASSTIAQDRSGDAVELQQVLDNVMPLLTAVQPQKLAATLNAVATALDGRGTQLGTTLVQLDRYLSKLNPELPALNDDIKQLVTVSHIYDAAAPDIVQALTDFTRTSGTIAEEQANLSTLYGTATGTAQDVTTYLRQNSPNIIRLAAASRGTLGLLAEYAPSFPCTLRTLADFVPAMDKALGKGTGQPGLHVDLTTVPSRGSYAAGKDTPVYGKSGGPQCYPVPYTGKGTTPLANSPQENELIDELLAPGAHTSPGDLPDWSSLLTGPVFRGAEVTVK
ncbi:MCE family protein [Actinacidiphila bryophytorum]|uniref:Phospholipid/cholesterol/gamma-HCH transport system substrate-binding protein n=1 Tax=Actinacidiphila bryophytorum TaxID=1436133 RepID=A0A9W4E750_9ACTN|nr:MCE family protein [Actinacidiphila bryophytorum]MBM9434853.1 MCE family protein [Actinacidiphila bryophytorum]MBN6544347.1 MCE family protein [Actinacidiphila bryophytorum]CAG7630866.1 Phospholipid/cholesterol/gamma-HCH transport system substrate-binding protein [Actinacidiphila bryophytorum]